MFEEIVLGFGFELARLWCGEWLGCATFERATVISNESGAKCLAQSEVISWSLSDLVLSNCS